MKNILILFILLLTLFSSFSQKVVIDNIYRHTVEIQPGMRIIRSLTANGNILQETVERYVLDSLNCIVTQPLCIGSLGTITVNLPNNQGAAYRYSINAGTTWQVSNTFTQLIPSTYKVVAKDSISGIIWDKYLVVINQPTAPAVTFTYTLTQPLCAGLLGSVAITPSGGSGIGYQVSTDGGNTWQNWAFSIPLPAGNYQLAVKESLGCYTATAPVTINLVIPLLIAGIQISTQNVLCNGGTGVITINVPTATLFSIDNGATYQGSNVFTNVTAGTYQVKVKNANNCESNVISVTLTQPLSVLNASISSQTNVLCFGNSTGTATVTATGGTGLYTYTWNTIPAQYTATASNLAPASYTAIVRDANNCTATVSTDITQPASGLSASIGVQTNVLCFGNSTGSGTVIGTGGVGNYTYTWNTNPAQYSPTASNLAAGAYTATVRDASNCTATASMTITQPTILSASISSQSNVLCFGSNTGSATVSASGGTGNYTYTWNTSPVQNGATASNLSEGNYSVTVRDANNCTSTATVAITQPASALSANIAVQTNIACFGNGTGSATVTAMGGAGNYTYTWNTSPVQYTATVSNLATGSYTATVKDANNCATSASMTITQPAAPLSASISNQTNVLCFGNNTGSATASATGGTAGYTYTWNTSPVQYGATATNLGVGNYTVTAKDANNCTSTANVSISQPNASLSASIATQTNVLCFGNSTGSATVSATGGTGAYTYTWNTSPVQYGSIATNLGAGTYTVTITDAGNCTTTASVTITQPVSGLTASISGTNVLCFGNGTGAADLTVNGGTTPYTYSWSNGATTQDITSLATGTYNVTITDMGNCTTAASVTITQPAAPLSASISSQTNVLCFGNNTGSATASATGGTAGYTYTWNTSPAQYTATANNLAPGSYTITVRDVNNCTTTVNATITQPATGLSASIGVQTNVLCFGNSTGSGTVIATGGAGNYTYTWNSNPVQYTATASNLAAGTYIVTVRDASNCTTNANMTITQPSILSANISAQTNVLCFGSSTGSATVSASGGTSYYTYTWNTSPIQYGASATNLSAGNHSVIVKDANNCTTTANTTITQPASALSANIAVQTNVICVGSSTGSATVALTGGTSPYTYTWNTFPTQYTSTVSNLPAGNYSATITDVNGCTTQSPNVNITEIPYVTPSLNTTATPFPVCAGSTTTFTTTPTNGGMSPTYQWQYNGNNIPNATNASVTLPDTFNNIWLKVSGAYRNTAAIKNDGTLWTWGDNSQGQLGDGTIIPRGSPIQIGLDNSWIGISCGNQYTVGLKNDGTLWAWGENSFGQLGDGTTTGHLSPTQIGSGTNWVSVTCGQYSTFAIKSDGTLWAWGANSQRQLGDGTTTNRLSPIQIGLGTNWLSVSSGMYHTLAIKNDGTLWAWGYNNFGQLGDGTTTNSPSPIQIGLATNWISVSCGGSHTLAIKADGTLWSWGFNDSGQLGDGTTTNHPNPTQIGLATNWISLSCGGSSTFALKGNGTLWAWGANSQRQLGDGTTTNRLSPVQIGLGTNWVYVSSGGSHTLGIKGDGTLWGWGYNYYGQLGDGTTTILLSPSQIGSGTNWLSVFCGVSQTLAIKNDSTLWAWGYNNYGQLGDGTTTNRQSPVQIGYGTKWRSVSSGMYHTLAIKSDGTLWAWGYNNFGQLGDGTTTNYLSPIQIGAATNWVSVSCGRFYTIAIKSDGTLWACGYNNNGQLGDGTTTSRLSLVQIGAATNWVSVSCGESHTLATKNGGTLWAWGRNVYGQLGDGTTTTRLSPTQIGAGTNWISVSCGVSHTLAIKTDGTLWAWGQNSFGQLGDGTVTNRQSPLQIAGATSWVSVSCGESYTLAIKNDGTLWACGYNAYGELGDGTTTNRQSLVQIGAATNWISVSCGQFHTLSIKSDGTLWAWGQNSQGQLGNGILGYLSTPTMTAQNIINLQAGSIINCLMTANNSCQTTNTAISNGIIVEPILAPNITITPSTNPACAGTSITFASTTSNGGIIPNYQWQKNGVIVGNNSSTYTDSSLSNGNTIKCILTSNAICITPSIDMSNMVTMNITTLVSVTSQSNVSCNGGNNGSATVSTTGGTSPYTYTWNTIPAQYTATANNLFAGTYAVTVRDVNNCTTQSPNINITETLIPFITPSLSITPNPAPVCSGTANTITANPVNGGISPGFQWLINNNPIIGANANSITLPDTFSATYVKVATAQNHTVAIRADGTLWAWGQNTYGQLGDSTTIDKNTPVQIGYESNWLSISCGGNHTLAIKSDGTLWAWGLNNNGQLGDGTTTNRLSPIQIGAATNWVSVSCGGNHSVAIKSDGTLWAWGQNAYGQLGDGTTINKNTPVQVGVATNWISVSGGTNQTLAIKSDGTLWAWGNNYFFQLGDGTNTNRWSPVQIGVATNWVSVSSGSSHTLAIKSNGTLWAWGQNNYGQLGNGTTITRTTPGQSGVGTNWLSVSSYNKHTVAIKSDGTLWGWGLNSDGQIGDGTIINKNTPTQIGIATNWVSVSSGFAHTAAINSGGSLQTWGLNTNGQLGNSTTVNKSTPIQIGISTNWVSVSSGTYHTLAVKNDGTLWAWGYNLYGQLGDGTTIDKNTPVQVGVATNWISVSCGTFYTVAVKGNGTLWAWGYNTNGQLGDGTAIDNNTPIQIGMATNWASVSCGANHTVAIKSDGTLWAWGQNTYGQLGDGTTINKNAPVQIGIANNWVSVSSGANHTIAIKSDGTLWAWGQNTYGQLGDGTTVNKNTPVQIGIANNWVSVSCGSGHTLAIKSYNTLWAWGLNNVGQLGDGTTISQTTPIPIGVATNWIGVEAGGNYSHARKINGTLWSWGYNLYGQLGDSTKINRSTPVQVGIATNWVSVSSGSTHSVAIKSNGPLWAWGDNFYGQLGDGTLRYSNTPTIIAPISMIIGAQAGNVISCQMTANNVCQTINTATSNGIVIQPTLIPNININPNVNPVCAGTSVTFTSTITNGGTTPNYVWVKNGIIVGNNSATYTDNSLSNGNTIKCILTSNATCANPTLDTSNIVTMSMPVLSANIINQTNVSCWGGNNGIATVNASGGTGAKTYTWNTIPPQYVATSIGLTAGTYSVTVRDAINCTTTASVTITQPAAGLTASISGTNVLCFGNSTGAADLTVNGGTTPYTYAWSNGATTQDLTGLLAGTYNVTITDAGNCTTTASVTITQPAAGLTASISGTYVLCFGNSTGAADLTVNGGTTPYSYSWSNGVTTQDITGLAAGTYNITITDAGNCTTTASVTITQPAAGLTASISGTNVLCFGNSTGAADLTVNGGTTPYTYSWSNGATTQDLTGLAAGTYNVTITDAGNCTTTASITITQPAAGLSASISGTNVLCFGNSTGAADLTVNGGTTPYTYSWSNGSTTQDITGLIAGTYNVTITDAGNCTTTASVTITQPAAGLSASISGTNVLCFGNSTGAADLTVNGGTTPYSYSWSNGATTQDITGLAAGTYNVTITDAGNCTTTASVTITQPAAGLSASISGTNVLCFGNSTGAADLTVNGGTTPYTYSWSNGANTQDITGLSAGTYNVTITDAGNCTTTASITITQPATGLSASIAGTNVLCFGNSTSAANLTVNGGTTPYTYSWSNGATTQDLTGLAAGTYNVTITDAGNCTTTASVTITQPAAGLTASISGTNVLCFGNSTGAADLTVNGGTTPYTYSWSNGATTQDITGLAAGTYNVTITDAGNCTTTASVTIAQPAAGLSASISGTNVLCFGNSTGAADLTVNGGTTPYTYSWSNGAITQDLIGLTAGTYYVSITDAANCTTTASIMITQLPLLIADAGIDKIICYGGAAVMIGTTSVAGITYTWSPSIGLSSSSIATPNANPANTTTYTLTIKDSNNCIATDQVQVFKNPNLTNNAGIDKNICQGTSTSLTTIASGGTAPYSYSWAPLGTISSPNSATTLVTPPATTIYTVTVTDTRGCTKTDNVLVTVQTVPSNAVATASALSTCYQVGQNIILSTNSPIFFTYKWYRQSIPGGAYTYVGGNSTYAVSSSTVPGTYTYICRVFTNAINTCYTESNPLVITINNPAPPTITASVGTFSGATLNVCASTLPVTFTASVSNPNGLQPSSWQWKRSITGSIDSYTNLPNGNTNILTTSNKGYYKLIITYPSGCTKTVVKRVVINTNCKLNGPDTILSKESKCKVFPNPSSGFYTLECSFDSTKTLSYEIMDAQAKLIAHKEKSEILGNHQEEIDISQKADGIYFLHLFIDDDKFTEKLIKD